jgi:hypothetical protein
MTHRWNKLTGVCGAKLEHAPPIISSMFPSALECPKSENYKQEQTQ